MNKAPTKAAFEVIFGASPRGPMEMKQVAYGEHLSGQIKTHRIHETDIFNYIWRKSTVNVGKYAIHGSYG